MTWRERILEWKPETEWQPYLEKWKKNNAKPEEWFTLWVWPEEDVEQTNALKNILNNKGFKYTEKRDYGSEYPASIDCVVYCLGDINITNATEELEKITVGDSMVYYEGAPVALISEYIDEGMML